MQVAKQVQAIVQGLAPDGVVTNPTAISQALKAYSELLKPWARSVAQYMLADVARRNEKAWIEHGKQMGRALADEIANAPTGHAYAALMQEQVHLITSLPSDAADRVHHLVRQGVIKSRRPADIARDILETGDVTAARARLIARTEVARSASVLTEARARYAGSEGYIWRTAGDFDVRESHQEMSGKYVRWDTKPKLSDGTTTHAGQIYNCRCWPDPVLPNY